MAKKTFTRYRDAKGRFTSKGRAYKSERAYGTRAPANMCRRSVKRKKR